MFPYKGGLDMNFLAKKPSSQHPYIPELKSKLQQGKITRREFLRNATLLGMSAAAAMTFAGVPFPQNAFGATPKRGGSWKGAMLIKRIDHPARMSWSDGSNIVRQFSEYLTETGPDNITRPLLLEKWAASDDLKIWDLYLKKGIKHNNGDEFNADDVMFTFGEWLNKDVGSSMYGLLSYLGGMQNVEKVNDYHVRMHLNNANIAVPEHLYHYPAFILHRNFQGDIIKQPVGTGPYVLEEFAEGQRAVFRRREDYWQKGADGKSLPYLDKVMYIAMDHDAALAGLKAGQLDFIHKARPEDYLATKDSDKMTVTTVDSAYTWVVRMRVDRPPWDDNRIRTALKMCLNREKTLQLSYYGLGVLAIDAHIAPANPEFCKKPIPAFDPKGARKLVEAYAKEKGYPLPLKVTLVTKNDGPEPAIAQTLKEMAAPAGIDITLEITEASKYWERWTEVTFGITQWAHRPLGVMVLPLAYIKESIGAWNETKWYDDEFTALLRIAEGTLDVEKRREVMCKIEDIMQERGPIGINYWAKVFFISSKRCKNVVAHPSQYHTFTRDMWLDG
jgi:peptide/nickel transport system substrate-binding protein